MNRTTMRENAFKLLYEIEVQDDVSEEHINLFFKNNELNEDSVKEYILDIVNGTQIHKNDITKDISKHLTEAWTYDRISKINKALLKLAVYEIVYKKIDFKIIINEVVELSKKYGEETSPGFVNGILASIIRKD
ncbi:MAG: transcription antitermination factor NusB [Oscillospiraceae bacterium]|nr:transcription antitermination factor NusB [Oscillospiraceae bacterium]